MKMKLVGGLLGGVTLFTSSLAGAASVGLTPSATSVNNGGTFTVTIDAVDMVDLYSFGLILDWDTGLSLVTADAAIETDIGSNFELPFADSSTPNQLELSASFLFGGPISGSFTVATLEFMAVQDGTSAIGISPRPLDPFLNISGAVLDAPLTGSGNITITTPSAVPLPAASWLMLTGIAGIAGVARRRRV